MLGRSKHGNVQPHPQLWHELSQLLRKEQLQLFTTTARPALDSTAEQLSHCCA